MKSIVNLALGQVFSWAFELTLGVTLSLALISMSSPQAQASVPQQELSVTSGLVEFIATGHPSALKIKGDATSVTGLLTLKARNVAGAVKLALGSLDTGIDLRNEHMKEKYLDVGKYPEAKLTITKLTLGDSPLAQNFRASNVPFEGTLELHGVVKAIRGIAEIRNESGKILCDAQFGVKLTDFNVSVPKYLGITVADDVAISAHVEVKPTSERGST